MNTKKRILVVDDERDLCDILQVNLESLGYEVKTALSADEALDMSPECYDLLLLDVMMDGMSGFELSRVTDQFIFGTLPPFAAEKLRDT